jgi:alanyl-tRNA synthetase
MTLKASLLSILYFSSTLVVHANDVYDVNSLTLRDDKEMDEGLQRDIFLREVELSHWLQEEVKAQQAIHDALVAEIEEVEEKGRLRGRKSSLERELELLQEESNARHDKNNAMEAEIEQIERKGRLRGIRSRSSQL